MKKNRTMRLAALLLVLTLITSCFVGGTFAKYTTYADGADTARVAKFGVVLEAASDLFKPQYDEGAISVLADTDAEGNQDDVVAPGTAGEAVLFTIAGAPEVDVQVTVTLNAVEDALKMVTLPAGTYTDWSTGERNATTGEFEYAEYTVENNYQPVKWTLVHTNDDGEETTLVDAQNLQAVESYLADTLSGKYEVEDDTFDAINGTYTLSWDWDFDDEGKGTNDKEDTILGQIAAGVETADDAANVNTLTEAFAFSILVEQVD